MNPIFCSWLVVLQLAVLALSARAQSHLQLALEDFVGHDQGVVTNDISDSFPVDSEAKIVYFALDVDANGITEIFVSRSDLASDGLWGLYSDQLDEYENIIKLGLIELRTNGMRIGERDGVSGYYEYLHGGAGKGILTFNSFNKDGILVALWEAEVEPQGKDKALVDSLHLGRFDPEARKPEMKIVPLRPVWESYVKRKQAKIREESSNHEVSMQTASRNTPALKKDRNFDRSSVSEKEQSNGLLWWFVIGIVMIIAVVAFRCRSRLRW